MTGVDACCRSSGLVVSREVGRVDPKGHCDPHVTGIGAEIVVGYIHVILGCSRWIPVHQEPRLVLVANTRWNQIVCELGNTGQ